MLINTIISITYVVSLISNDYMFQNIAYDLRNVYKL